MKKLVLFSIICFFSGFFSISTAQTNNDSVVVAQKEIIQLDTEGGKVYSGIKQLKRKEVENILAPYPEIYLKYTSGMKLKSAGKGLLIGGGVLTLGAVTGSFYEAIVNNEISIIGLAGVFVGGLMLEGGLACTIVGNIKTTRSIRNYNEAINPTGQFSPGEINYQLGLLDNGRIGVQLRF